MTELTDIQQRIKTSLIRAISDNDLKMVQETFNSNGNDDIQAALRHKETPISSKDTILDLAIVRLNIAVEAQVEIIKLIWEKANQKTRDFVCDHAIENFQNFRIQTVLSDIPALETVIQEMEEHKRVMDLNMKLIRVIKSLNVNQVKAALENCGENVQSVLDRRVYWNDGDVDAFLVFPLEVKYSKELNQEDVEKIKDITKLLWNKASHDVRNSFLEYYMVNREGQNTGDDYIIDFLEEQQEMYRNIAGEGWLKDFIQEVKDYKKSREEELSKRVEDIEEKEPIADNKTTENNDTNFWSEHKGKIALGVTGLCVAGAVAAYVLAYPAVALALAVLAAVILMGAGIAKVLEDPSVEKSFQKEVRH
ncbi:hypothetical protein [Wolbachia endosymbiont (group A) of Pogonocherus hispidulus]|uniref:hypothetical protein n=1 Tax=Wolbachia endosymbiont (group A) of Pogonocherus hispidulus TaxID=3066136 RepID=UPI00333F66C8